MELHYSGTSLLRTPAIRKNIYQDIVVVLATLRSVQKLTLKLK